jgi:CRP-like cAMP-binding protein
MAELNLVEKVIALEGVELLGTLSPEHLATIATVATEVQVPPGRVILEAAKPVEALYIILDGSVELIRNGSVLDTAGQNAVLGAWALFDEDDPIPLTARAVSDTHLLRVGRERFLRSAGRQQRHHDRRLFDVGKAIPQISGRIRSAPHERK